MLGWLQCFRYSNREFGGDIEEIIALAIQIPRRTVDHDPKIPHITEKLGFFEELTCRTPSDFNFTLVNLELFL